MIKSTCTKGVPGPHILVTISLFIMLLGGCAAAAVGVVVVTTVDIVHDRRSVGIYVDDNAVEVKIRRALKHDAQISREVNISVTSMNGIVLLTGEALSHDEVRRATAISRGYTEARQVINEIEILEKTGFSSRSRDSWITTKVKSALVRSRDISASRVKVVTERGNVYLLGMVTTAEADAAVEVARRVKGVVRIVKAFEYI